MVFAFFVWSRISRQSFSPQVYPFLAIRPPDQREHHWNQIRQNYCKQGLLTECGGSAVFNTFLLCCCCLHAIPNSLPPALFTFHVFIRCCFWEELGVGPDPGIPVPLCACTRMRDILHPMTFNFFSLLITVIVRKQYCAL